MSAKSHNVGGFVYEVTVTLATLGFSCQVSTPIWDKLWLQVDKTVFLRVFFLLTLVMLEL